MLRSADSLVQLMKQQIDALVAQDPYLQEFLMWASQKSQTILSQPKVATTRAFYLALAQTPHTAAHFTLASTLDQQNRERLRDWWQQNYAVWVEQVRATIASYRNTHHPWQFTPEQQQALHRYYDANQLLIDCLNSNCEVTTAIRQEIEATLLLPQKELEDREWQGD
jgi:predicted NACHT family NTPase